MLTAPRTAISRATTTNVYVRWRASLTIHIIFPSYVSLRALDVEIGRAFPDKPAGRGRRHLLRRCESTRASLVLRLLVSRRLMIKPWNDDFEFDNRCCSWKA